MICGIERGNVGWMEGRPRCGMEGEVCGIEGGVCGKEKGRGMWNRRSWWRGVWGGGGLREENVGGRGKSVELGGGGVSVADLRFDKGGFKSKIRMRAHFLQGTPPTL